MDRKQMCIANVQYKKPSDEGAKQSKNLLRYLTYRESRDEAAQYVTGRERWIDHGMGGSVAVIAQRCDDLKSEHVLTFSLVINPSPDLMSMVAPEQREQFVGELTENVIEDFFDARGLDTGVEFSWVIHHRLTDDPQAPGLHDPHSHVVLPGTAYDEEHGQRVPLFFSRNRTVNHIDLLHDMTEKAMVKQMERYVGSNWEQRFDELIEAREQECQIVESEPHGVMFNDKGVSWNFWCGMRRTDEQTSAVGYYKYFPAPTEDDPDALRLEFHPLVSGLPHEQATIFAQTFAQEMNGEMNKLNEFTEIISGMSAQQRDVPIQKIERYETPDVLPDFEF